MKTRLKIVVGSLAMFLSMGCFANELPGGDCAATKEHVAIASVRSLRELGLLKSSFVLTSENQLLLAMKGLELLPTEKNASSLIAIAPRDASSIDIWQGISATTCDSVSNKSLSTLVRFNDNLPSLMSRAVFLAPSQMATYLRFNIATKSVLDSEFQRALSTVCKSSKLAFHAGLGSLTKGEEAEIKEVIDTTSCKLH